MQSRFSNAIAKSLHKNQCIHCTSMQNGKPEAHLLESKTAKY